MELEGKIALVTGAASGIGKEISIALLENGIENLVLVDINQENLEKLQNELNEKHGSGKTTMVVADVTNQDSFENAFKETLKQYKKIDIVVNNVGIINDINYELMINVNLGSVVRGINLAYKYFAKCNNKSALILNTASLTGFLLFYPFPVYGATKSGVIHLSRCYGHQHHYARTGVRVMALCPGYTPSTNFFSNADALSPDAMAASDEFVKHEKIQTPDHVGRAALHIIKNGETGSVWSVDGGDLYKINVPSYETFSELVQNNI